MANNNFSTNSSRVKKNAMRNFERRYNQTSYIVRKAFDRVANN